MCTPTSTANESTQLSQPAISLPTARECMRIVAAVSAVALTVLATAAFIVTGSPGALITLICFSVIALAICTPYSSIGRIHMHYRPWGRPGVVVHTAPPRPWWRPIHRPQVVHVQRPCHERRVNHHQKGPGIGNRRGR